MDTFVKRGEVYLQHHKHSEKWKKYWLNLYPDSGHGVARLELTEASSDRSPVMVRRHLDRKVVRLSECISVVRLPPHAEAHPGDNMAAFCVETDEKRLVFAVEKEGCGEWVEKICNTAFQKGSSNVPVRQPPQMAENQIYASREEVFDFWVTIQHSEASARCGLLGAYWLQAGEDTLIIKDPESRARIMDWPYKLLRRYGRDKTMFSIEAGRRCDSGPGTFNFETNQSEEILRMVELAIRQQKNLSVSAGTSPRSPCSPLPRRPFSGPLLDTQYNSICESSVNTECIHLSLPVALNSTQAESPATLSSKTTHKPPSNITDLHEPVYSTPIDLIHVHEGVYSQPVDAIRSQQTVKNGKPGQNKREYSEPVYADPVDIIRPNTNTQTSPCSNPANVLKLPVNSETFHHCSQPEPVYSEVFHVPSDSKQNQETLTQKKEEPIYSLPDVTTIRQDIHTESAAESKPDTENKKTVDSTVIYSQVNKALKSTKPQDKTTYYIGQDVISENLGLI